MTQNILSFLLTLSVLVGASIARSQSDPAIALVYNGTGACPESCAQAAADRATAVGLQVRMINEKNWAESAFANARVWIQPGGKSREVARALSAAQKQRVRDFVAAGGGYVGFCAGAFIASQQVQASDGSVVVEETFDLLPLTARGYGKSEEGLILPISWLGKPRSIYWEGGPYFLSPLPNGIESIGVYTDKQESAAVRAAYGHGRVVVSGFHPEAPQWWRDFYHLTDPDGLDFQLAEEMIRWALN